MGGPSTSFRLAHAGIIFARPHHDHTEADSKPVKVVVDSSLGLHSAAGLSSLPTMMTTLRYVFLVLGIVISLHFILSFSHDGYKQATTGLSASNIQTKLQSTLPRPHIPPYKIPLGDEYYISPNVTTPLGRKANATFVVLGAFASPPSKVDADGEQLVIAM